MIDTVTEPKFVTVLARDVKPYHYALWCSIEGGEPFANQIMNIRWRDGGTRLSFMLDSHNFFFAQPNEELELIEVEPTEYARNKYGSWVLPESVFHRYDPTVEYPILDSIKGQPMTLTRKELVDRLTGYHGESNWEQDILDHDEKQRAELQDSADIIKALQDSETSLMRSFRNETAEATYLKTAKLDLEKEMAELEDINRALRNDIRLLCRGQTKKEEENDELRSLCGKVADWFRSNDEEIYANTMALIATLEQASKAKL